MPPTHSVTSDSLLNLSVFLFLGQYNEVITALTSGVLLGLNELIPIKHVESGLAHDK